MKHLILALSLCACVDTAQLQADADAQRMARCERLGAQDVASCVLTLEAFDIQRARAAFGIGGIR